ncbi:Lcl domain-containing protein [Modicisalibacter radicis]|uniref:Lcl domain-containing protein n=1 Tax=Halomonas sp. EAR18 TaxID=2518972 RepID=UPI00109D66A8|nr:DUF1566 domain-containing protein [Halomonas sp. EAR18]
MANFPGAQLTDQGRQLQAKAQIGTALTFTRVALGDGSSSNWETMTGLDNEMLSLSIQGHQVVGDGTSRLRVIMTNEGLVNGFFVRELGVFARDPDTGDELLYSYTNAGNQPDFLPAGSGASMVENVFDLYTVIGNAQSVTAVISDYITIATKQDIDKIRPQLLPVGGLIHQLARKRSNTDGDVEWFDPAEGVNVAVESIEERRVAVTGQRTFSLAIVSTRGMAAYVNGQRVPRSGWEPLGETQMRFASELVDGDEVLFVRNEEVGELEIPRVSLDGPALIYPDSSNSYTISDYDGFAQYAVTASRGTVSRSGDTITLALDAAEADGPLDLNITRDGAGVTYPLAVGAPTVAAPELTGPGDGATGVELSPTLQATAFKTYPGDYDTHASADWQIATDAAFADVVWESAADADHLTSIGVPAGVLDMTTQYYARVRYNGASLGASAWSAVVGFETTDQYIVTPSITAPTDGATGQPESPVLECSAFATNPAGVDTHFATSWRVRDSQGAVMWERLNDSANKTGIAIPAGVLQESMTYTAEVRHIGESLPSSQWSAGVAFTTSASFIPEDGNAGEPFGGGYFVRRMMDENGAWYALVVSQKADGEPAGTVDWYEADSFVAAMSSGGYSDWRLPTIDELRILYRELKPAADSNSTDDGATDRVAPPLGNYTSGDPARTNVVAFRYYGAEAFSSGNTTAEGYTSADTGSVTRVFFRNGNEVGGSKTYNGRVRAVRRVYL